MYFGQIHNTIVFVDLYVLLKVLHLLLYLVHCSCWSFLYYAGIYHCSTAVCTVLVFATYFVGL